MKLIGLLSFYDEHADWLTAAIASHTKSGMTDIVVVDGAYELFPQGRPRSGVEQHRAITSTCDALGIGLTLHTPQTVWYGNEVEKRSFMFKLGLTVADSDQDWFMVIDADHLMTDPDPNLPDLLAETDLHVAEFSAWQRMDPTVDEAKQFNLSRVSRSRARFAFRANPGLHCRDNHFTYVDGEDRLLWATNGSVEALDLGHIKVEHRTLLRDVARHEDQYSYYRRRTATGVENGPNIPCDWVGCALPPENEVWFGFEFIPDTQALSAGGIKLCKKHTKRAHHENRMQIRKIAAATGIDYQYGDHGELLRKHT